MEKTLTVTVQSEATYQKDIGEEMNILATHKGIDIETEFALDETVVDECMGYGRGGANFRISDTIELLNDRTDDEYTISDDRTTVDITVEGSVDEWLYVGTSLANKIITVGSDDRKITTACDILYSLADDADRLEPYYAILRLMDDYDVKDLSRADIIDEITDEDVTAGVEAATGARSPPADD